MSRFFYWIGMACILLAGCSESKETRMQRLLIQGNEKIVDRDYEQAEKYFQSALRLDSCFADALNNLGTVEHRRRNLERSEYYYTRAIACDSSFYLAYVNRAGVYYEMNDHDLALADIRAIEMKFPDSTSVAELKGLVHWKLHESDAAIAQFRRLAASGDYGIAPLINLGSLYTTIRRYDSARYWLVRAREVDSTDHRILNAEAMLFSAQGKEASALSLIDRALAGKPNDPYYLNNKGYILMQTGHLEEALALIDRSIVEDPSNGWAYRNKGIYHFHKENLAEAIRLLRRAEEIDPAMDELDYWLGQALLKQGNRVEACTYLRRAADHGRMPVDELPKLCDGESLSAPRG